MIGGPSLMPISGPHGWVNIVPRDGTLSCSGSAPTKTYPVKSYGGVRDLWGDAEIRLSGVGAGFSLSMGWFDKREADVLLYTLRAWCGLGFRVGPYPGRIGFLAADIGRTSGVIPGGAELDIGLGDPAYGGRVFHLKSDLAWSAALAINVPVPVADELQDWGAVTLPCSVKFAASCVDNWTDGDEPFPLGYYVGPGTGYDHPTQGYNYESPVTPIDVEYEWGWSEYFPGHFVQGFKG